MTPCLCRLRERVQGDRSRPFVILGRRTRGAAHRTIRAADPVDRLQRGPWSAPPRGALVKAHNPGVLLMRHAELVPKRCPLSHQIRGDLVVVRDGEKPRHVRDRGLDSDLVDRGANGGANRAGVGQAAHSGRRRRWVSFCLRRRRDSNPRTPCDVAGFQIALDHDREASELTLQTPREQVKNTACSRAWTNPLGSGGEARMRRKAT
jgi:hypothetical protein